MCFECNISGIWGIKVIYKKQLKISCAYYEGGFELTLETG